MGRTLPFRNGIEKGIKVRWSLRALSLLVLLSSLFVAGIVNRNRARKMALVQLGRFQSKSVITEYCLLGKFGEKARDDKHFWLSSRIGSTTNVLLTEIEIYIADKKEMKLLDELLTNRTALQSCEKLDLHCNVGPNARVADWTIPFPSLCRVKSVRSLSIHQAKLSTSDFLCLGSMNNLEILMLDQCDYSPEDLKLIANLDHLAWLSLPSRDWGASREKKIRELLPRTYVTF